MGSRIPWEQMTRQLLTAESDNPGPINVYTLTVISKGLRTGDWASSTSIDYFLDTHSKEKIHLIYAKDVQALLKRSPLDDHFWIAFFDLAEWPQHSLAGMLKDNGYRVGDAIVFQQLDNRIVLLPAWRK